MSLKTRINEDMKVAMKAREVNRLSAIRLLMAAIKQREIDERTELDDSGIVAVVDKMLKQRRDSIVQYELAARQDLANKEQFEIDVLTAYLPQRLSEDEIDAMVTRAVVTTGATSIQDMGKLMAELRPLMVGRADLAQVSKRVRARLACDER